MADNGFGVSFLPNGDRQFQRDQPGASPMGGGGAGRAPIQEAVQVMRMRVPRVMGGAPISPYALLTGQGSGGMQEGQLAQLMRTLGLIPDAAMGATMPAGPDQPTLTGAPSPFAAQSMMAPAARPSGGYGVGISAGSTDPSAGGGAPPPSQTPSPYVEVSGPPAGGPSMPGDAGQDSEALWDMARRQREAMGRIAY